MARGIQVGDKAPDFTLSSQAGEQVHLSERLGQRVVVLYFYPKDETPGCTKEACAFRDSHEVFAEAGAEVIGVSSDSVDKHAAFASHHQLPFTLLSDEGGQVRKSYGVPATLGLLPGRVTYVIDRRRHCPPCLQFAGEHRQARQRRAGRREEASGRAAGLIQPSPETDGPGLGPKSFAGAHPAHGEERQEAFCDQGGGLPGGLWLTSRSSTTNPDLI